MKRTIADLAWGRVAGRPEGLQVRAYWDAKSYGTGVVVEVQHACTLIVQARVGSSGSIRDAVATAFELAARRVRGL